MKYYRLIKQEGWNIKSGFIKDKIYPLNWKSVKSGITIEQCLHSFRSNFVEVSEEEYLIQEGKMKQNKIFVEVINKGVAFETHPDAKEYGLVNYHLWKGLKGVKEGNIYEVVNEIIVNDYRQSYILKDEHGIDFLIAKDGCKIVEKEEEFVLPERWCIKVTGNSAMSFNSEIYKWRESYWNGTGYINEDKVWTTYPRKESIEITLEQFKNYVLKENNMKKIIGYKLVKPEFLKLAVAIEGFQNTGFDNIEDRIFYIGRHSDPIEKWEVAGILKDWFEPVYGEEYKVGDWVVVKSYNQANHGNGIKTDNLVTQLYERSRSATGSIYNESAFSAKENVNFYNIHLEDIIRKATETEIENSKIPYVVIKDYPAEIKEKHVNFGCQTYSKEFVIQLSDMLEDNDIEMDYRGEVKKLAKYFKNK